MLSRLRRLFRGGGRRARRRRNEQRTRVLLRFATRPDVGEDVRAFLIEALGRLRRLRERLRSLDVAPELMDDFQESILATLEREAARERSRTRVRSSLRGPLPSTVTEEQLLEQVVADEARDPEQTAAERARLLQTLDEILADVEDRSPRGDGSRDG